MLPVVVVVSVYPPLLQVVVRSWPFPLLINPLVHLLAPLPTNGSVVHNSVPVCIVKVVFSAGCDIDTSLCPKGRLPVVKVTLEVTQLVYLLQAP